jgi:MFS family permease
MLAKIRQGMRFVVRHPILGPLTIGTANLNMWEAAQEALYVVFLVRTLHTSPGLTGALLAAPGVGGALGAAVTGRLSTRLGSARALLFAVTVGTVAAVLVPLSTRGAGLSLFAVGTAILAGLTVTFSIIVRSFRQTVSPRHLLGRVTATTKFLTWGVLPIGALIGGVLGQALGNRTALWVVSAGLLLTPIIVALTPVRRIRDLPTSPDGGGTEAAVTPARPPHLVGTEAEVVSATDGSSELPAGNGVLS